MDATPALAMLCITGLLLTAADTVRAAGAADANVLLDAASIDCLTCHDAALDPLGIDPLGHPVGVVYGRADAISPLRPRHLLPSTIALPDGRVSCLSCHLEDDGRHGDLVIENAGSALCANCHEV